LTVTALICRCAANARCCGWHVLACIDRKAAPDPDDLAVMKRIDELYLGDAVLWLAQDG